MRRCSFCRRCAASISFRACVPRAEARGCHILGRYAAAAVDRIRRSGRTQPRSGSRYDSPALQGGVNRPPSTSPSRAAAADMTAPPFAGFRAAAADMTAPPFTGFRAAARITSADRRFRTSSDEDAEAPRLRPRSSLSDGVPPAARYSAERARARSSLRKRPHTLAANRTSAALRKCHSSICWNCPLSFR